MVWHDQSRNTRTIFDRLAGYSFGWFSRRLARIVSFSQSSQAVKSVEGLLDEGRYFIEWSAPDLLPDRVEDAARLVDIQRGLTRWYWNWSQVQEDVSQRHRLRKEAQQWADEVLKMSGLLEE
jgi:hypothetical protein